MIPVVNIKTCRDFGTKPGDVYIGREMGRFKASAWANPIHVTREVDRDEACDRYEKYIEARVDLDEVDISALSQAKRLGCWCSPERCHGDYLAKRIDLFNAGLGHIKIISGGQTGVDQGALEAAKALGIPTGGYIPAGYKTEAGLNPTLAKYGLVCTPEETYLPRTARNVKMADVTFWTGSNDSPGFHATQRECIAANKPFLGITYWGAGNLRKFIYDHPELKVLNFAGSRESLCPGIQMNTRVYLLAAFTPV